jgi:DNA-nicking Smr family endonuclease
MSKRPPTPEERSLWRDVMQGVKPLKKDKETPVLKDVYPEKIIERHGLQRRQSALAPEYQLPMEKLSSRQYKNLVIESRIDLHGFTQEAAAQALVRFFLKAQESAHKWVLVISGKGEVLQRFVPEWFEQNSGLVIGYGFAEPKDGGQGAFYVRVRKPRQ